MVTIDLTGPARRRPKTLSTRRLRQERAGRADTSPADRAARLLAIVDEQRPQRRVDCRAAARPCLYVSCRFHLYLDANEATGSVKLNFPHLEPWELLESCALDVAERGGLTLEEIGALLNVTRERARQLEQSGLDKLRAKV